MRRARGAVPWGWGCSVVTVAAAGRHGRGAMGKRLVARLPGALRGVKKMSKQKVGNQE